MYLPVGSFLLNGFDSGQKTRLDSLRSAEPPINYGSKGPMFSNTTCDDFLVAIDLSLFDIKVSIFLVKLGGSLLSNLL